MRKRHPITVIPPVAGLPATESHHKALGEVWHVTKTCGVCGMQQEVGIDAEGDIVYAT